MAKAFHPAWPTNTSYGSRSGESQENVGRNPRTDATADLELALLRFWNLTGFYDLNPPRILTRAAGCGPLIGEH